MVFHKVANITDLNPYLNLYGYSFVLGHSYQVQTKLKCLVTPHKH